MEWGAKELNDTSPHKLCFMLLVDLKWRQCNLSSVNIITLKSVFKVNQTCIVKSFIRVFILKANAKVIIFQIFIYQPYNLASELLV